MQDIRWVQRFNNFTKAFETLRRGAELNAIRALSELEQ